MLHDAVCSECMYIHHGKSSSLPAAAAAVVTAGYGSVSSRRTRGEGTETFRFRCGAAAVFPTDWLAGGQDVWPGGAVVTRSFPFGMGCVCVSWFVGGEGGFVDGESPVGSSPFLPGFLPLFGLFGLGMLLGWDGMWELVGLSCRGRKDFPPPSLPRLSSLLFRVVLFILSALSCFRLSRPWW
jgi:hypothetical protein